MKIKFILTTVIIAIVGLSTSVQATTFGDVGESLQDLGGEFTTLPSGPFSGQEFTPPEANPFTSQLQGEVGGALPGEYVLQGGQNRPFSPFELIARIIRVALGFLGVGSIVMIIWAGARWMTAGGNDEQVGKAKKTLKNAVIGLIIILTAFSLSTFIISRLQRQTAGRGGRTLIGEGPDLTAPRFAPSRVPIPGSGGRE